MMNPQEIKQKILDRKAGSRASILKSAGNRLKNEIAPVFDDVPLTAADCLEILLAYAAELHQTTGLEWGVTEFGSQPRLAENDLVWYAGLGDHLAGKGKVVTGFNAGVLISGGATQTNSLFFYPRK